MNEFTAKIVTIVLFILTYIGLLVFTRHKSYIALGTAIIFVGLSILPYNKVLTTINWNLLLMLFGIMGLVELFNDSNMPSVLGDTIIAKTSNLKWAIVFLCALSGIISAFVDNVATVLIIAPITINICKKTDTSPILPIIGVAIMSNLQGAATLVGDTTSILLGAQADMNFFDFFVFEGKMGLFFVVQISMLLTLLYLMFVYRNYKQKVPVQERSVCKSIMPTVLLILSIVLLIAASFIPEKYDFGMVNGVICTGLFLIGMTIQVVKNRKVKEYWTTIKRVDFHTLLLIAALFVIIGGVQNVGLIDDIAGFFVSISQNPFVIYTFIVAASVLLSAFIDNIPYVAAMLPVTAGISTALGIEPYLLYFGLISGATLGGNLTPIGASANIAATGLLRKEGYKVKLSQYFKVSIPFTLIAVLSGYALVWITWGM